MQFELTIKGNMPEGLPELEIQLMAGKYFSALFQIREKLIETKNNVSHAYIDKLVDDLLDLIPDISNIP